MFMNVDFVGDFFRQCVKDLFYIFGGLLSDMGEFSFDVNKLIFAEQKWKISRSPKPPQGSLLFDQSIYPLC